MKKEDLIFRMAARCEAAGRPNNEDNYQVDANLADDRWGFTADKEISLGDKGALLLVCDGMGGMNAGEVASAIAVATIKEWFDKDRLTDKILESSASIQKYIVEAIQAADAAIKEDSKINAEHDGMGSTIVLAWLLGKKVYIGWCGDSRAYRYNPQTGLMRLSHDHSYVQELVDAGKLTEELAFDHPNNNIITRSLGDPRGKAQPDTKEYDLYNEDIIMLCSDGLCGCLRDNEIEDVIKRHQTSMQECRDALWVADEEAGWHDNVTIALAQVISGGIKAGEAKEQNVVISTSKAELLHKNRLLKWLLCVIALLLIVIVAVICWYHVNASNESVKVPVDTTSTTINQPVNVETVTPDKSVTEETPVVLQESQSVKKKEKKEIHGQENKEEKKGTDEKDENHSNDAPIQVVTLQSETNQPSERHEDSNVTVVTMPQETRHLELDSISQRVDTLKND